MLTRTNWRVAALTVGAGALLMSACKPTPTTPLPLGGISSQVQNLPSGAQDGTLKVPMVCTLPAVGPQTFLINLTGIAATSLGKGQEFWLTQGHGNLQVPRSLTEFAAKIHATSASTTITDLNFNVSNATPPTRNAAATPIVLDDIPLVPGQSPKVIIPKAGVLNIGPFTAAGSGIAEVSVGTARAALTLRNAEGVKLLDIEAVCDAPSPKAVLVGLDISGPAGLPPSKFTGVDIPDADLPTGYVVGSLKETLACTIAGVGDVAMIATLTGTLPAYLPAGQPYYLQDSKGILEIPASTVDKFLTTTGASRIAGSIDTLDIDTVNTSPTVLNAASPSIAIPAATLQAGKALPLSLPGSGALQIGPFVPAASGQSTLLWGASGGKVDLLTADGSVIESRTVSCKKPNADVVLLLEDITTGPVPEVNVLSAHSGPAAGGTSIVVTGANFTGTQAVNFGFAAAEFTIEDDHRLTVIVPPHAAGKVDVTVLGTNGPGVTNNDDVYEYR